MKWTVVITGRLADIRTYAESVCRPIIDVKAFLKMGDRLTVNPQRDARIRIDRHGQMNPLVKRARLLGSYMEPILAGVEREL